jgi:hypothetical protein
MRQIGANVVAACFIVDLPDLGGAAKLRAMDVPVRTLMAFAGPIQTTKATDEGVPRTKRSSHSCAADPGSLAAPRSAGSRLSGAA